MMREEEEGHHDREARAMAAQEYNRKAMAALGQGAVGEALAWLARAERLAADDAAVLACTLNNQACAHRRAGRRRAAIALLKKAEAIERRAEREGKVVRGADTKLNLAALLSETGEHLLAYKKARAAVRRLQREGGEGGGERAAVYAVALHNLAVQEECLGRPASSLATYERALDAAARAPGAEGLVARLRRAVDEVGPRANAAAAPEPRPGQPASASKAPAKGNQQREKKAEAKATRRRRAKTPGPPAELPPYGRAAKRPPRPVSQATRRFSALSLSRRRE